MFRQNTAAFVHDLPEDSLSNVDVDSTYVRVQVLTNAGALDRAKQRSVVAQFTELIASAAGDPSTSGVTSGSGTARLTFPIDNGASAAPTTVHRQDATQSRFRESAIAIAIAIAIAAVILIVLIVSVTVRRRRRRALPIVRFEPTGGL